ncbi:MAG TPA: pyridoxal-phosphate dependent enzyme [Armatimonadetes bacterium]|nr:pyridoxal-phosphate dependent enzyme [Armatimonadota bacterium]
MGGEADRGKAYATVNGKSSSSAPLPPPLDLIGNTPLIRLYALEEHLGQPGVEIYGKAEWFNPGGSVKDRPALWMVLDGERRGLLTPEKIILDATSGNTGIAYALIGTIKGYRVRLVMPANVSEERKRILAAYGAEVIYSDPLKGTDGAIEQARVLWEREPELYFLPDQYNNPANPQAHYESTAPEILRDTQGRITHFIAGLGTTGTLVGAGRRLKEFNPDIRLIAVQPDRGLHGLEGLKHLPTSIVPGIYEPNLPDERIFVCTEEAYEMMRWMARQGLLLGQSASAALVATLQVARSLRRRGAVMVVMFPDGGDRYLSTRIFEPRAKT